MINLTVVALTIADYDHELTPATLLQEVLPSIALQLEYTIVGQAEHHFSPQGYTAVLLLGESHLSVHTWPEEKYLIIELLSCKKISDNQVHQLKQYLQTVFVNATIREKVLPIS